MSKALKRSAEKKVGPEAFFTGSLRDWITELLSPLTELASLHRLLFEAIEIGTDFNQILAVFCVNVRHELDSVLKLEPEILKRTLNLKGILTVKNLLQGLILKRDHFVKMKRRKKHFDALLENYGLQIDENTGNIIPIVRAA